MRLYNFGFLHGLRVTAHLKGHDRTFAWTQIRGIQIGPWFIGAIRGTEVQS